jgi:hypothetical protein
MRVTAWQWVRSRVRFGADGSGWGGTLSASSDGKNGALFQAFLPIGAMENLKRSIAAEATTEKKPPATSSSFSRIESYQAA